MLYLDTQKLSTGPNRTKPDSIRWKCPLTRLLPKTRASKFVRNTRAALRSLRMNFPGSVSSAAILCNFSKLISGVKPFEVLSAFRSMFVYSACLLEDTFCSFRFNSEIAFLFFSSLRPIRALWRSLPHFLLSLKGTPALLWEPFYFITVRRAGEHMVYKNTTPLSPFPSKALPPPPHRQSVNMVMAAAAVTDPIILKTMIQHVVNLIPLRRQLRIQKLNLCAWK